MACGHGFRASELIDVRIEEIGLRTARTRVRLLKGSLSAKHSVEGDDLRAFRAWLRSGCKVEKNNNSFDVIQLGASELT